MKILLVRAPLLGADLEAEFLGLGVAVDVREPRELDSDGLLRAAANGVQGLVSINHSPELALLCSHVGMAYVSWTIDPLPYRRWTSLGGTPRRMFVHRKALLEPLLAMGHPVEWMPLACASRRWTEPVAPRRSGPALFVGSSLQDERRILTQAVVDWDLSEALPGIDSMLADLARACLWDRGFAGFLRQPQAVPASLREALPELAPLDLAEALDAGLAWHFRRGLVALLAGSGVEIKGDDGWREVAGEGWTGPLRNGLEMTRAYAEAAVNLDVPRFHQREIATLRAFDCLGSGGLLACEAGTEMDGLFAAGEQFLSWSNREELGDILERASGEDPSLDRIALAGREAVLAEHRLDQRARRILEALG